jgi:hypothetical protein
VICCGLDMKFWPVAKEYLKEAISLNGALDEHDVLDLIMQQKMQLWGIHDGALKAVMVTEILEYPTVKHLNVALIGGDSMSMWDDVVVDTLERFGKEHGATAIQGAGRRGWVKHLEQFGFKEYATVMIKEIA